MRIALMMVLVCLAGVGFADDQAKQHKMGQYLGAKETIYPDWFKTSFLDFSEDVAEAAEEGKRVMVIFHQDNCPYCNALVERNLSQRDVEEQLRKDFDVIAMNMWGDREVATIDGKIYTEKTFAQALKVQFTPTILILNEQGGLALRLNGYLPPAEFKLALAYAADSTEGNKGYRKYLAANTPEQMSGDLIKAAFFDKANPTLKTNGKPYAVFFEQRDCPLCIRLHEKVLNEQDSLVELAKFRNIQLDMWGKRACRACGWKICNGKGVGREIGY